MLKNFVGMTPYHVNVLVHMCFRNINFRSCHRLRKYFYKENFQYNISFTSEHLSMTSLWKVASFSFSEGRLSGMDMK